MIEETSVPGRGYDRLSGLDASFLSIESRGRPMHMGAVAFVASAPWLDPDGALDADRLLNVLTHRACSIRGLDRRLARTPLSGWPIWVRPTPDWRACVTLGRTVSDYEEVRTVAQTAMATHLDRARALWRIEVLPGLDGGKTFAILFVAHHAFVDGIAGMDLLTRFLDGIDSGPAPLAASSPPPRLRLLMDELLRWANLPVALCASGFSLATGADQRQRVWRRTSALIRTCRGLLTPGPKTSLNGGNEGGRTVSWFDIPDRPLLLARKPLFGSVNDMVLAAVSQALAGFPGHGPFRDTRAAIPVSLRARGERHDLGNRIGLLLTPLEVPTLEADRVSRIGRHTAAQKRRGDAEGYEVLLGLTAWMGQASQRLLNWLVGRVHPYGILVTSVPGPSRGHTLGGAEVAAIYPLVPLFSGQSVSVALIRYRGAFRVGVTSSWPERAMLDEFTSRLREAFAVLARPIEERSATVTVLKVGNG